MLPTTSLPWEKMGENVLDRFNVKFANLKPREELKLSSYWSWSLEVSYGFIDRFDTRFFDQKHGRRVAKVSVLVMDLLASCRWGASSLTTEPWPLGAPRLPFAQSFQFVGQNEKFQGALTLGKPSTSFPSFSLQFSEQVGRDEGSPSKVPVTAGMTPLSQGTRDTHPQQPHRVLWRYCIWQLSKGKAEKFVKMCS